MHHQSAKAMCSVQLESNMQNCNHDYDTTDGHDYDDNSDTDDDVNYDESNTVQAINCDHELCCTQGFLQKSSAGYISRNGTERCGIIFTEFQDINYGMEW